MAKSFIPLREKAVRIMTRVLGDGQSLDETLDDLGQGEPSEARAWLLDICSGTLRWKGRLDLVVDSLALKKKPTGWLRKVLLVATGQILLQDRVPPAMVVSETVDLIKQKEGEFPAKFANAILRKVVEGRTEWSTLPFPEREPDAKKAAWASLPLWFWKRLVSDHGEEWASAFARATLERPSTWIRARNESWRPEGAEAGPIPLSWRLTDGGLMTSRSGFAEGEFIVQDLSSQSLIHEVCARVKNSSVSKILDLCAAPGGKSIALLWNGFQVTASDKSGVRLGFIEQNKKRVGSDLLQIISSDDLSVEKTGKYDLVWVDAPCTGSGIIRRHPDTRWLKEEKDIQSLVKMQSELIQKAANFVKPGGYLVYSVCSVFKAEGEGHLPQLQTGGKVIEKWLLSPQDSSGDGFWGCFVQKN